MKKIREGCFWCKYLSKSDIICCTISKDIDINIFDIFDNKPDKCPFILFEKGEFSMVYKGFKSSNIEGTENNYYGTVENSREYIKFKSEKLEEIEESFHKVIDNYIAKCESENLPLFIE